MSMSVWVAMGVGVAVRMSGCGYLVRVGMMVLGHCGHVLGMRCGSRGCESRIGSG